MLNILKKVEETSSRNEKLDILKSLSGKEEKLFKRIAFLCYDPSIDFYIKEFSKSKEHLDCVGLESVLWDLEHILASRTFTGNMAKQWLEQQYEMLSEDNAEILRRVIKRDMRCGISAKTVNKVWPGTIYEHPYMRCSGFSEKSLANIKFPCYSQTKMDALYCDIIVRDDKVEYRSRNGSFLKLNDPERDQILKETFDDEVIMGEAIALDDNGELMNRQASNGYLNSNDIDPSRVVFYVWDLIPYSDFEARKSKRSYKERFEALCEVQNDFIIPVNTVECNSKQDILDHFKRVRELGEEGTIIKNKAMHWKPGTSKDQIKCKVIFDVDLIPKDWKYGEGKHQGVLGSIRFESADGKLSVWVGGGYTDNQRKQLLNDIDAYINNGTVGVVRGNDVIFNKDDPNLFSIFLPRFVEFRFDKNEADDIGMINEQVESFTDALDQIK